MRRIGGLALAALVVAGCGSSSHGGVHRLNAWNLPDDAFIPNVGRAPAPHASRPAAHPASAAKPVPAPASPAAGAPSDAQVKADLRAVYGGSGDAARRISLAGNGMAEAPPDAPDKVQAIVTAANQVA